LFDYLPADTLMVVDAGVEEAAERFRGEVRERHESLRSELPDSEIAPRPLPSTETATRVPLLSASPKRCSVAGSELRTSIAPLSGSSSVTLASSAGAPCPTARLPSWMASAASSQPSPIRTGGGPPARRRVGAGGRHLSTRTGSTRPKARPQSPRGTPNGASGAKEPAFPFRALLPVLGSLHSNSG